MNTQSFSATITPIGSKVGIQLPFDPQDSWGDRNIYHVTGTVNGRPIRGALEATNGRYFLALGPTWRRDNGLDSGDSVTVVLMPEGPQLADLAPDILEALSAEPEAKAFFESLATFYRKGYLRWIDGARKPEQRAARITEMVGLLNNGQKER